MRAIVNVAVGRNYPAGQMRLEESLDKIGDDATRLFWLAYPEKSHDEQNYGFKVDAVMHARKEGFDQVFWLDASCIVVRALPWDQLTTEGIWLGREGWTVGQWINDNALNILNLTREEALQIPLMEGKIIGFDFTKRVARDFLNLWKDYRDRGAFQGDWSDHRHDISVGAVVAHRMGLTLNDRPVVIGPPGTPVEAPTSVLAAGCG